MLTLAPNLTIGLLNRCVDDTAPAEEIAEYIPDDWRKAVNVIEKEIEPLGNTFGRRGDDDFELNIKSDFECQSGMSYRLSYLLPPFRSNLTHIFYRFMDSYRRPRVVRKSTGGCRFINLS